MKQYTYLELNAFVNRASTTEQVRIAHDFLIKQSYLSAEDMEFLLEDLQQVSKDIQAYSVGYEPEVWEHPDEYGRWR